MEYAKHLYTEDTEGYINCTVLTEGKAMQKNTRKNELLQVLSEYQGKKDSFITPNSFYKPWRKVENIRHLRALYIDLDIHKVGLEKSETVYQVAFMVEEGKIPKPSMIVDSGRGIHLYWRINHAPMGAIYTWQNLEDYLYHQLKPLGADIGATDGARLLRIPGSINGKNGKPCKLMYTDDSIIYDMKELRKNYLEPKERILEKKNPGKVSPIRREDITSYSLHQARAQDIKTLTRLRLGDMEGCRNTALHCFVYWRGIYIREPARLEEEARELNNRFNKPLPESQLKAILRSIPKSINKFIEYEQGLNMGIRKRVSKGMRDKGGYWYRNETLIEKLEITEEEQRHLKTIISKSEKYRRRNEKRNQDRRNENGLTPREQKKVDRLKAIKELKDKGKSNKEVAHELGISIKGVEYYLYN